MDLGSDTLSDSAFIQVFATAKFDHTYDIVRAGINYQFNSPYTPLK